MSKRLVRIYLPAAFFLCAISSPLYAQQLAFGAPDHLQHGTNCNINSSPGITGKYYYVLFNDYGPRISMDNDIDSYLKIYNIRSGNLIKSIYLNAMVSANLSSKRMLFKVILWKNRLVGLYAAKRAHSSEFEINAQLLDPLGEKIGASKMIDVFPNNYKTGVPLGSFGFFTKDQNMLGATYELHYAFNSDSSQLALFTATGLGDLGFTILDPDLKTINKVTYRLPEPSRKFVLLQFEQYHNSTLYLLEHDVNGHSNGILHNGKGTESYTLHAINVQDNTGKSIPVSFPENIILDARFSIDGKGNVLVGGVCHDQDKTRHRTEATGMFAMKIDAATLQVTQKDIQAFSSSMIRELAASKDKGAEETILINKIIELPDGGITVFGQSRYLRMVRGGTGGMIRAIFDGFGNVVFSRISAEGKINWSSNIGRNKENLVMTTSNGPIYARYYNNHIIVVYDDAEKRQQGLFFDLHDEAGNRKLSFTPLPKPFSHNTQIIWGTAQQISAQKIIVAYYQPGKKEMGTVKINLP